MPLLPDGTVTFLLSDIEGSTRLWADDPAAMRAALTRHDALAAGCFARHAGILVKARGEGDSLFAVFTRTTDAVAAALEFQRALFAEAWETPEPLRVRIAVHPGEAALRDDDYYGPAVNRCARLRNIAHGGQVLLSLAATALAGDHLPTAASLQDLGVHRLRDLASPEHVFQLLHPELPTGFGALRSLDAFPNNLPRQLTSFVGREREMNQVRALLENTHMLTLTGSGGCGKTRLALQVAVEVLDDYPDGAWLVELARVTDPLQAPAAVAALLGVREETQRPLLATLAEALRERSLLLILDNCEHLVGAVAELAETLLRSSTQVRVLATSREALGIAGETTWQVPPLTVPDPRRLGGGRGAKGEQNLPAVLGQYEAVRLFIDRAVLAQPSFAVTNENAPAVAQICHRLDGIPLAIELAAARVKVLTSEQIAARLDDRFRLLTGGSRTALPRQQTLRALIDWSYDLLSETERALLCRLAPFAGGWTLESAEAVCADALSEPPRCACLLDPFQVLDLMTQLVDKSLVGVVRGLEKDGGGETRYRLLETVRQYATDRLAESGDAPCIHDRHAAHFTALVEQAAPELYGANQEAWLDRLELEHDNLRAALKHYLRSGDSGGAARVCAALWWFWSNRGYWREGRDWILATLALPWDKESAPHAEQLARAQAQCGLSMLLWQRNEFEAADEASGAAVEEFRRLGDPGSLARGLVVRAVVAWRRIGVEGTMAAGEESLRIHRELGDTWGTALSLHVSCNGALISGDLARAGELAEESYALFVRAGDAWGQAMTLNAWGQVAVAAEQFEKASSYLRQAEELFLSLGNRWAYGFTRYGLGISAWGLGERERADELLGEAERINRSLEDFLAAAHCLLLRGQIARELGRGEAASSWLREALTLLREVGDLQMVAVGAQAVASVALDAGRLDEAAALLGATAAIRGSSRKRLYSLWLEAAARDEAAMRTGLGETAFQAAWERGAALTLGQTIALAESLLPARVLP